MAGKTKTCTLTGKIEWARLFEFSRDLKGWNDSYVPCDGAYTVDIYLDKDNFDLLKSMGAAKATPKAELQLLKEGTAKIKFVRKHKDRFEWASGAPKVTDLNGNPWDEDVTIGNGSEAEVTISVYETKGGIKGSRLEGVKITNLVSYIKPEEQVTLNDYQEDLVKEASKTATGMF